MVKKVCRGLRPQTPSFSLLPGAMPPPRSFRLEPPPLVYFKMNESLQLAALKQRKIHLVPLKLKLIEGSK